MAKKKTSTSRRVVAKKGAPGARRKQSAGKASKSTGRKTATRSPAAKKKTPKKPAARKPVAKKAVAKKATAKKATAKKATAKKATAKKAVAKRATAKKAAARKPIAKRPAAKRATAKKATAKKPVAKRATAKKAAARKPIAKRPAAKKATAKKAIAKGKTVPAKRAATKKPVSVAATDKKAVRPTSARKKAVRRVVMIEEVVPTPPRPLKSPYTKTQLRPMRKALMALRKRTLFDLGMLGDEALRASDPDVDAESVADHGSDAYERNVTLGLMEHDSKRIRQIDNALEAMDGGTYGACQHCADPIPLARLEALPFAATCVSCKEREERRF